jgi:hypothetical protein
MVASRFDSGTPTRSYHRPDNGMAKSIKCLLIMGKEASALWDEMDDSGNATGTAFMEKATKDGVDGWLVMTFRDQQHMQDYMDGMEMMSGYLGDPHCIDLDAEQEG